MNGPACMLVALRYGTCVRKWQMVGVTCLGLNEEPLYHAIKLFDRYPDP